MLRFHLYLSKKVPSSPLPRARLGSKPPKEEGWALAAGGRRSPGSCVQRLCPAPGAHDRLASARASHLQRETPRMRPGHQRPQPIPRPHKRGGGGCGGRRTLFSAEPAQRAGRKAAAWGLGSRCDACVLHLFPHHILPAPPPPCAPTPVSLPSHLSIQAPSPTLMPLCPRRQDPC